MLELPFLSEGNKLRKIVKHEEPLEVVEWKKKFKNKNNRKPNFEDLFKDLEIKQNLKNGLIAEQNNLCGYCCGELINPKDDSKSHIEHIKPKAVAKYANLSLEYTNLMASCTTKGKNRHCGAAKEDDYDEKLFISPYDEQCEKHFAYKAAQGIIEGKDEKAVYMITLLKLDDEVLNNARKTAYQTSGIAYKNEDELKKYINVLKKKDCSIPYCDMLLFCAEEKLNEIRQ